MLNGRVVHADGTQEWWRNGQLHREGDQPARILGDGAQVWCMNGQRHREGDQPAVTLPDGTRAWYLNGQRHRGGDQPAVIWTNGWQEWWARSGCTRTARVTDFREASDRFALVQAVVAIGTTACVPHDTGSALGSLLQAVQASLQCGASSYHVAHEHAFLVALFL